jgi:RNA polymerase sigma-70 factor, ECF subfamily
MAWADLNDQDLLDLWRKQGGDEGAHALVERHYARMFNLFYRLTGNRSQAEELTQDLFMRLTEQIGRDAPIHHLGAWLHTSAMNLWRDWVRREATARSKGIAHSGGDEEIQHTPTDTPSAYAAIEHQLVRRAVLSLESKHREVIALCHFQGLTYEEAAMALNLPIGTIRSRLHYALEALRERLNPTLHEVNS